MTLSMDFGDLVSKELFFDSMTNIEGEKSKLHQTNQEQIAGIKELYETKVQQAISYYITGDPGNKAPGILPALLKKYGELKSKRSEMSVDVYNKVERELRLIIREGIEVFKYFKNKALPNQIEAYKIQKEKMDENIEALSELVSTYEKDINKHLSYIQ